MRATSAVGRAWAPAPSPAASWPGGEASRRPVVGLLIMLLFVPALLIVAHVMHHAMNWPSEPAFDLGQERGYGELFWELEMIWAGSMLLWLAWARKMWVLAAWAYTGAELLLDDRFTVHEQLGPVVAALLPGSGAANAVGEVVWLGFEMVVAGVIVLVTHWRSSAEARALSAVLLALFVSMAFFGAVVDALHALFVHGRALDVAVAAIEDGGELVVMSLIVTFLFAVGFAGYRPFVGRLLGALAAVPASQRRTPYDDGENAAVER